jgi:hypothetical protein
MPAGLVRDGGSYRNGNPVTLPKDFGNQVNWSPSPSHFGNLVPPSDPSFDSNPVTWQTPDPTHFGNPIPAQPVGAASGFELEDSSGVLLLESGDILLLEMQ